jgi:hypothetical protein
VVVKVFRTTMGAIRRISDVQHSLNPKSRLSTLHKKTQCVVPVMAKPVHTLHSGSIGDNNVTAATQM